MRLTVSWERKSLFGVYFFPGVTLSHLGRGGPFPDRKWIFRRPGHPCPVTVAYYKGPGRRWRADFFAELLGANIYLVVFGVPLSHLAGVGGRFSHLRHTLAMIGPKL